MRVSPQQKQRQAYISIDTISIIIEAVVPESTDLSQENTSFIGRKIKRQYQEKLK